MGWIRRLFVGSGEHVTGSGGVEYFKHKDGRKFTSQRDMDLYDKRKYGKPTRTTKDQ